MERSRSEYSFLNIVTGFGGFFLNTLVGYICRMVFVRCLPPTYLGINGLFSNIVSMLSLAELGIGGAIGFALYKPLAEHDQEKVKTLMNYFKTAYVAIAVIITIFGLVLIPLLPIIINDPPNIPENLYVIYLFFLFNTASSYLFSYKSILLTASQRNYIVLGVNYFFTIVQSTLQIFFLLVTKNYMIYLTIQIVSVFINNLVVSKIAQKKFPYLSDEQVVPLDKSEKRGLFINVKALMIDKLATILVNNTDNIVMTYFDGIVSVGLISNYTLLVNTLSSLTTQLFAGITASVGNLTSIENVKKQYSFFRTLNLANFWIFSWGAIGIAFVSNDLVCLCFGGNYVVDSIIPALLAINFYILGMQTSIYTYKNAKGLFRYSQYILLFTAALNLILDILLGRNFGIVGIILATIISRLLTNAWFEPFAVYRYGFKKNPLIYLRIYLNYLVVLLITAFVCYEVCSMCSFSPFINVITKAVICTIIPNSFYILLYRNTREGRELLSILRRVLKMVKRAN